MRKLIVVLVLLVLLASFGGLVLADDGTGVDGTVDEPAVVTMDGMTDEDHTLVYIGATIIVLFMIFLFDYLRTRNVTSAFEQAINRFTSNAPLADALEKHYLSLPEELRRAVDIPIDLMILASKMNGIQADDVLAEFFEKIRDGKPNEPPVLDEAPAKS